MFRLLLSAPGGGGGGGGALPTAGLIAWWKADAGVTKDGSDKVSAWADQSGNGHHITQASAGDQPTWEAAIKNGLPGIRFPNTTGFPMPTGITGVYSVLAVITYPSAAWSQSTYLLTTSRSGQAFWGFPGSDHWEETPLGGAGGLFRHNGVAKSHTASLAPLNRSHYFVGYADTGAQFATPSHSMGSLPDFTGSFLGHLHEMAFWSTQLTGPQITAVEGYVTDAGRYGSSW